MVPVHMTNLGFELDQPLTAIEPGLGSLAEPQTVSGVRQRLIEVAARHFAEHGVQGASQRAIQREVGVNNSTVNYYFGSKDALYRAVVDAAVSNIQTRRKRGLKNIPDYLAVHDRLRLLLEAYLGALLDEANNEIGYHYVRIVVKLHLVTHDPAYDVIEERLHPVRELYVDALARIFPNSSRSRIYEVVRYVVGLAMFSLLSWHDSLPTEKTVKQMTEDVTTIATLAFESLCQENGST